MDSRHKRIASLLPCILALVVTTNAHSAPPATGSVESYEQQIKPLLREHCFSCHGALKQESDLRLDTVASMQSRGILDTDDPDASVLLERLRSTDDDERMPPKAKPVSQSQIDLIRAWMAAGAPAPPGESPDADPRDHWAFKVPQRPDVAGSTEVYGSANPVDAFLQARRQAAGTSLASPADRRTLLRRVYLDLIGVPPMREQVDAFLGDKSPDAYERVVDRLLASPMYGERWGRHWMDVWRYSDWYGRRSVPDVRNSYPGIWRWRDWIVRSLNEDKGYDQMVREMLAADEISPGDDDNVVALGFIVRNWFSLNRYRWHRDIVEHVGKAFLGLRLNCALCHDHKYDPITQRDYFRFVAFFEPIEMRQDRVPGGREPGPFEVYKPGSSGLKPVNNVAIRIHDRYLDRPTYVYANSDPRVRVDGQSPVKPGIPSMFNTPVKIEPVRLPVVAWYPGFRKFVKDEATDTARRALEAAQQRHASAKNQQVESSSTESVTLIEVNRRWHALAEDARAKAARGMNGRSALQADASHGRQTMALRWPAASQLPDEGKIRFNLLILQDGHVNFQLARSIPRAETAAYVAFEEGVIRTYAPGGFQVVDVGKYTVDPASSVSLEVELQFGRPDAPLQLTVKDVRRQLLLVDNVNIARNGWDPMSQPDQGFFLDVHPSPAATRVMFDGLRVADVNGHTVFQSDFEEPRDWIGLGFAGVTNWEAVPKCGNVKGISVVSLASLLEQQQPVEVELWAAARRQQAIALGVTAAAAEVARAQAVCDATEARIAADEIRFGHAPGDANEAIQRAAACEQKVQALQFAGQSAAGLPALLMEQQAWAAAQLAGDAKSAEAHHKKLTSLIAECLKKRAAPRTTLPARGVGDYTPFSPTYPQISSGRRKALADWIASPKNPLTARVAVNHIWLRHFGRPLVETVYDFGHAGKPPTHPKLLDWLAVELVDSGWSMKHLHRLLVTSQLYRSASGPFDTTSADYAADPKNETWWHYESRRMQAEELRDSMMMLTGSLDFRQGGKELPNTQSDTIFRRSIYFESYPEDGGTMPLLASFDPPDPTACYRRTESSMPQQSLAMMNSGFVAKCSALIAARLAREMKDNSNDTFIEAAFESVLCRKPNDSELAACRSFLGQNRALPTRAANPENKGEAGLRAWESLVRVLLNHHEFATVR